MANPNPHAEHRDRLRRRIAQSGIDDFAPHEVLEYLLTICIPRKDVNPMAHALIEHFGSLSAVLEATPARLAEVPGVGEHSALFLSTLPSLLRYYATDKCNTAEPMDTMAKITEYLRARFIGVTCERVYLLLFDNGMRLIECYHVGDGTVNGVNVMVRAIAERALSRNASSAVLAHNHPGGMAIPSSNDIEVTENVAQALDILSIPLLDHLIVANNTCAPLLRNRRGQLRAAVKDGGADEGFYRRFYGEEGT